MRLRALPMKQKARVWSSRSAVMEGGERVEWSTRVKCWWCCVSALKRARITDMLRWWSLGDMALVMRIWVWMRWTSRLFWRCVVRAVGGRLRGMRARGPAAGASAARSERRVMRHRWGRQRFHRRRPRRGKRWNGWSGARPEQMWLSRGDGRADGISRLLNPIHRSGALSPVDLLGKAILLGVFEDEHRQTVLQQK